MLGLSSPTQVSGQSPNRLKLLIIYSGFSQKRKRVQILQFCIVISVFTSATSCGGNAAPHPPQDLPSKEITANPFRADSILLYRASTLALKSLAVSSRRLSRSFFFGTGGCQCLVQIDSFGRQVFAQRFQALFLTFYLF